MTYIRDVTDRIFPLATPVKFNTQKHAIGQHTIRDILSQLEILLLGLASILSVKSSAICRLSWCELCAWVARLDAWIAFRVAG